MIRLGMSLMSAGCTIAGTSGQEDLERGIVRGKLGTQLARDVRLPIPVHTVSFR